MKMPKSTQHLARTAFSNWAFAAGLTIVSACGQWPRHENTPLLDDDAISVDGDVRDGVPVEWREYGEETEPNNDNPHRSGALPLWIGNTYTGALTGWGWDKDILPDREAADNCDQTWAFPPTSKGDYTGDVDWLAVMPESDGRLCASLEFGETTADLNFDFMLYELDDCSVPVAFMTVEQELTTAVGLENGLGFDIADDYAEWSTPIEGGKYYGIALAGFKPGNSQLQVEWKVALSLVSNSSLCPSMPEF